MQGPIQALYALIQALYALYGSIRHKDYGMQGLKRLWGGDLKTGEVTLHRVAKTHRMLFNLQVILRKRATNYRVQMSFKASYDMMDTHTS